MALPEKKTTSGKRVWLHAVSVGEVLSCTPLIQRFQERGWAVFLSTTTESGFATAQKRLSGVELFFFPFDFWFICNRFLKRIDPDVVLICEVEIWPSFIWCVQRRGKPLYLVSGRMAEKDFRQYRRFKWFFSYVLSMFSGLFMQNEAYTERMHALCPHPRLKTLGNLKFDAVSEPMNPTGIGKLMPKGLNMCASSTHRGDEWRIIRIFQSLSGEFPRLRLVLVPRHPHRKKEITRILDKQHISYTLRSEGKYCRTPVFIVDTVGELMEVYQYSDIVIMGGELLPRGGGSQYYRTCPF
jgi:3-deoxy-D-manno-octulosonic-acid transferase